MKKALTGLILFGLCFLATGAWAQESIGRSEADDYSVTGSITDDDVHSQEGKPPVFGHCYNFKKMDFFEADWIENDLKKAKWPNPIVADIGGERITKEKWIEIDTCSRTMMAEVGTAPACLIDKKFHDYAVAWARIVANRAFAETHPKQYPIDANIYPVKAALENKYQYAVWNKGAKIAGGTPCPDKTGPNKETWDEYLGLCKTAVLDDGARIKARTTFKMTGMTDDILYYTSGCKAHYQRLCEGYIQAKAQIATTTIDDYKCFEMWRLKRAPTQEQTDLCSTKAQTCCTELSAGDHVISQEMKATCDSKAKSWWKPKTAI